MLYLSSQTLSTTGNRLIKAGTILRGASIWLGIYACFCEEGGIQSPAGACALLGSVVAFFLDMGAGSSLKNIVWGRSREGEENTNEDMNNAPTTRRRNPVFVNAI